MADLLYKCMETMRTCTICKKEKPFSEFGKHKLGKYGLLPTCKECEKIKRKERYWKNRDDEIKNRAEWRKNNKDKDKASYYRWKENNPDSYKACWKRYNKKRRISVLKKVANGKEIICRRCGCDIIDLLEINHINGGGLKEVKRQSKKFYSAILNGTRKVDDLELLCRMCNILHYAEMKFGTLPYRLNWRKSGK